MTLQIEFDEDISNVFVFFIANPSVDRKVLINLIINLISSLRPYQITFEETTPRQSCCLIVCWFSCEFTVNNIFLAGVL